MGKTTCCLCPERPTFDNTDQAYREHRRTRHPEDYRSVAIDGVKFPHTEKVFEWLLNNMETLARILDVVDRNCPDGRIDLPDDSELLPMAIEEICMAMGDKQLSRDVLFPVLWNRVSDKGAKNALPVMRRLVREFKREVMTEKGFWEECFEDANGRKGTPKCLMCGKATKEPGKHLVECPALAEKTVSE